MLLTEVDLVGVIVLLQLCWLGSCVLQAILSLQNSPNLANRAKKN